MISHCDCVSINKCRPGHAHGQLDTHNTITLKPYSQSQHSLLSTTWHIGTQSTLPRAHSPADSALDLTRRNQYRHRHTHTHTRRLERRTSLTFMLTFSSLRDLPCSPVHLPQSLHREAFCSDVADCLEAASFLRDKLQLQPPRRGHRYSCRPGDLPGSPSPRE